MWAKFAESKGRTVRWRGNQYTEELPLCIVTQVIKTNQWALTEVSNASRGAGLSLKLQTPAAEGSMSGSYSWEIHSPSDSRVVPPPISPNFSHSVFIKALRIKFRRRIPFVKSKVDVAVFDQIKSNDSSRGFLGGRGDFRPARPSNTSEARGGQHGGNAGYGANISLEAGGQWPADEYEVSVESSSDSAQVGNSVEHFKWCLREH
jgi:hypothetical protein